MRLLFIVTGSLILLIGMALIATGFLVDYYSIAYEGIDQSLIGTVTSLIGGAVLFVGFIENKQPKHLQ